MSTKFTERAVDRLHKGLGVRQDLDPVLFKHESNLGVQWGIVRYEQRVVQLAKVQYRLAQVFRTLPDERGKRLAPVLYNMDPDPEMCRRDLGGRKVLFVMRHPNEGYSERTLSRILEATVPAIKNSLQASLPEIPAEALRKLVQREQEFAVERSGRVHSDAFARLVRRSYTAPMDEAVAAFLRLSVVVPRSQTDGLIVARTAGQGDWLCVFSTEANHETHRHTTRQQPWSGRYGMMLGADLVREVVDRWRTVGIVVDPPGTRSSDAPAHTSNTLRLPASELPRLIGRH
ncbi:MAG: hypothetical protein GEV28_34470 [Actinophytocola sp.]|uniref:hypothetical protein n=1 Tax=Actinophytocola sp. TaxID=1872138 RepID=UPI001329F9C6|nr:hypothetical protein [Actinophytocola sp.]MPZ85221.1 hypothetical protein [Actinophytocola sp.]